MSDLTKRACVPCEGGVPPLPRKEAEALLMQTPEWAFHDSDTAIYRDLRFSDFNAALAFVNKVGALAEREGHHPDIDIRYNKVRLTLATHAIGGLSENDFILAAKINKFVENSDGTISNHSSEEP